MYEDYLGLWQYDAEEIPLEDDPTYGNTILDKDLFAVSLVLAKDNVEVIRIVHKRPKRNEDNENLEVMYANGTVIEDMNFTSENNQLFYNFVKFPEATFLRFLSLKRQGEGEGEGEIKILDTSIINVENLPALVDLKDLDGVINAVNNDFVALAWSCPETSSLVRR